MNTTQKRIDTLAEELRDIYQNTNEGPRLIAEMVEQFPKALAEVNHEELDRIAQLEDEVERLEDEIDSLTDED